jgi:predicted cytidylate kinase
MEQWSNGAMDFMIISFSGAPGAGKSTIAQKLAEKLDFPRYYIGGLRRQKAKERGMTLEEYNKLGEIDPSTDLEVDEYQEKLGKKEDNFVIEGRTSWYFIPHSLKIYLDVDLEEGASRIKKDLEKDNDRNEGEAKSLEEVKNSIKKRMESDQKRYKKYFDIDVYNRNNYDIVVDTTYLSPEEAFKKVYQEVEKRLHL